MKMSVISVTNENKTLGDNANRKNQLIQLASSAANDLSPHFYHRSIQVN